MSLTAAPLQRILPDPGVPFVVYAIWAEFDYLTGPIVVSPSELDPGDGVLKFSAANLPGGPLGEFAVSGSLAVPLSQVDPSELPIALSLRLAQVDGHGVWEFDFHGQSEAFGEIWRIPPEVQPSGPRPQLPEELNQGAQDMLREAIGLPPDAPIPDPAGPLPPEQQPDEPYRFDPTRHMDLGVAEPAPPLPPPAPPGPPPPAGAQTFIVPPAPPPQTHDHGAFGDGSVPFAH